MTFTKCDCLEPKMLKLNCELQCNSWNHCNEEACIEWTPHRPRTLQSSIEGKWSKWLIEKQRNKKWFHFLQSQLFLEQKNLTKIMWWHKLEWLNIYFIDHERLHCTINCWKLMVVMICVVYYDPKSVFPFQKKLVQVHISRMLTKTMECFVLPKIVTYSSLSIIFYLWMSHVIFDTFALVVNFIDDYWVFHHVTISLFEGPNIYNIALLEIMKPLLWEFQLTNKVDSYVKDDNLNLGTLKYTLAFVVNCEFLDLPKPFASTCFWAFLNICFLKPNPCIYQCL